MKIIILLGVQEVSFLYVYLLNCTSKTTLFYFNKSLTFSIRFKLLNTLNFANRNQDKVP